MELDTSALDALRDEPGGLIVAANHPSMLDALVVVARLPRGVCVMKAELLRNVFLGGGARLAQYIRNDVGRGMVRDAVASLREGNQLVLFPEGTRTVTSPINAFKPGITLIAHLAGVPIQTVVIETASPYLKKGWPLLKAPPVPVRMRVRLGRRFAADADHRALLQRIERYFAEELGR
jgi:1-acyl-sn-glycerol-3-phosphate acyltransferase